MKKKQIRLIIIIFLLQIIHSNIFSQKNPALDSLLKIVAMAEAKKTDLPEEELVRIYLRLANHYHHREFDKAEKYLAKAMSVSRRINYEEGIAHAQGMRGTLFLTKGAYDSAIYYFKKSLGYYELVGDTAFIAKMHNNIGLSYDFMGKIETAISFYMKSLKAKQQLKDTIGIITCLNNIGISFFTLERYDEAIKYHKMCLPLEKKVNDVEGLVMSYLNIGETYRNAEEFDLALKYLISANEQNKRVHNNYLQAMIYDNLGLTYMKLGQKEKALTFLKKSMEINLMINNKEALLSNYSSIADYYYNSGELDMAGQYYIKVYDLSSTIGFIKPASDAAKKLSEIFAKIPNYKRALHYHQIYSELRDSVISIESNKLINEMRIKYETEQKDNEIKLLNKENEIAEIKVRDSQKEKILYVTIAAVLLLVLILVFVLYHIKKRTGKLLKQKNDQLRVLNFTKDKFISILAHDLKNPFSGFVRMTHALNDNYHAIPEDKKKQYINTLSVSAKKLNDLLWNMLQWATIQNNLTQASRTKLNVNELVNEVIDLLSDFAKHNNSVIHNRVPEDLTIKADKTYLTIIFNNLLTNAIKFSDGENTVIVSTNVTDEFVEIAVSDEGVGMNKEDINKLFKLDEDPKSIGNHAQKGTGLGLILCKDMLEKMNGTLKVESKVGVGSVFMLYLPLTEKNICP